MAKPIIAEPPVKAKPSVDMDLLAALHPELMNDSFVYVHCHFNNQWQDMLIRIWRTTFLVDRHSASKAELIHAENITYAPLWTLIPDRLPYTFLLIFTSLPKSCRVFDLMEQIAEPGGFHVANIARNETDVYHVDLV
ncbi:MAG: hypothetical protein JNL40_05195 [Cyclobacteriaceae bacterium]|nr:hypothetical protein [Cyclobacteriaceae bacterium]